LEVLAIAKRLISLLASSVSAAFWISRFSRFSCLFKRVPGLQSEGQRKMGW